MICTVYLLVNNFNNKVYVGQTWHLLSNRMGKNGSNYKNSIHLYGAIKKYGINSFKYEILSKCKDQITADCLEEYFINKFSSKNPEMGYNIKNGGSAGKHSDKTKEKISKSIKNKNWSEEALLNRAKGGKMWKGKKRQPHTEYRKKLISENSKKWHMTNIHPMKGKHHSEESKLKISQKSKGRKFDPNMVKNRVLKIMIDVEVEKNVIKSYKDGYFIYQIEKMFNISKSTIYRVLKRNNIDKRLN